MPRGNGFKPGEYKFLLELPPDLNLDLHAFCELFYSAPKAEVTRRALRLLIDTETSKDTETRRRFNEVRRELAKENGITLTLVRERKSGE